METPAIIRALGLAEDVTDREIIQRIAELREAVDEDVSDLSDAELIRRGEHEAVAIEPWGATVTLYFPIACGTEQITTLEVKRPKAKHLKKMDEKKGGDLAKVLSMLGELTGRTESDIDKLDAADVKLCSVVIGFLRQPPRRTGPRS